MKYDLSGYSNLSVHAWADILNFLFLNEFFISFHVQ